MSNYVSKRNTRKLYPHFDKIRLSERNLCVLKKCELKTPNEFLQVLFMQECNHGNLTYTYCIDIGADTHTHTFTFIKLVWFIYSISENITGFLHHVNMNLVRIVYVFNHNDCNKLNSFI